MQKLMINLLLISAQLPTGRWHSPKNTQGKRMFELAKMLWIFERINEVTLINLKLGE